MKGWSIKLLKRDPLNYRLKYGYLKVKKRVIPTHILPYSKLRRGYTRGNIEREINGVFYLNRDEVKFITLEYYNRVSGKKYSSIKDLTVFLPHLLMMR